MRKYKEETKEYSKKYNQEHKEERKKYNQEHKKEIKERQRKYREEHKEEIKKQRGKYNQEHKEEIKEYGKKYRKEHKKEKNRYMCIRRQKNIKVKLSENFSANIRHYLKEDKNGYHWESLIGYTLEDLMNHLEFLFEDNMSWSNYGEWVTDHIIPVDSFNFTSYKDEEFKKCWSIDNLRPCWKIPNIIKGNKVDWDLIHQIPNWLTLLPKSLEKEMNK